MLLFLVHNPQFPRTDDLYPLTPSGSKEYACRNGDCSSNNVSWNVHLNWTVPIERWSDRTFTHICVIRLLPVLFVIACRSIFDAFEKS